VVKVSPIDVLKDPEYYIKMIKKIERLRNEEIERKEHGLNLIKPEEIKKSEWE